jgi:cytosine/adenosine deaminase-related metal-dependent hydrolase
METGNPESSSILLSNGVVLTHGPDDHVIPRRVDILVKNNIIDTIAPDIKVSDGTTVIDCTNKILSPGFIDTHHHVWQTLLKGRYGNDLLFDYMLSGMQ